MENIKIKELIEFNRKSAGNKKNFALRLRTRIKKEKSNSGGGHYWISSLSTIRNVFKTRNIELLNEKISILNDIISASDSDKKKIRFQRNLDVLLNFTDFDFDEITPSFELTFQTKIKSHSVIRINRLPILINPDFVVSFNNGDRNEIGAIWFVTFITGYKYWELGLFVEAMNKYLHKHYSEEFFINKSYCIAVDINTGRNISFQDVENGKAPYLLEQTITDINQM